MPKKQSNQRPALQNSHILIDAVKHRKLDRVREILKMPSIDVNIQENNTAGMTSLHTAMYMINAHERTEIIKLLLAHPEIDVNKGMNDGATPLYMAVQEGHKDIVKMLLAHPGIDVNKDVNTGRNKGESPIFVAAKTNMDILKMLLAHPGIDVNKVRETSETPLYLAAQSGLTWGLKLLLAHPGIDVNKATNTNTTPLHIAAQGGYVGTVKLLLDHPEIDVNKADNDGTTPLYMAVHEDRIEIIKLLLTHPGIDVNKAKNDGITPLYTVAYLGNTEIIKMLLAHPGIDVNKDVNGFTSLYAAAEKGHKDIVKLLIADPRIVTDAKTTKAVADKHFSKSIIELFLGESYNSIKWKGYTQSDVTIMNTVFDPAVAVNWSACPVCLKYAERSEACKYMKHNCSTQGGYYHEELYNKFKSQDGKVDWCTVCGRICLGHRHYALARHDMPHTLAKVNAGANAFSPDCVLEGGGGLAEKVIRFKRLREQAKELNNYIGELTEHDAYTSLVELTWDAPLLQGKVGTIIAKKLMEKKEWNIPATNFLPNAVPVIANTANNVNSPNVVRTALNLETLKPVVLPEGEDAFGDEGPLIQFHHRQEDGTINHHDTNGVYDLITAQSLTEVVKGQNKDFAKANFGYCWSYPATCKARLYPDEIKEFVPAEVYEEYRKKFNRKFAKS